MQQCNPESVYTYIEHMQNKNLQQSNISPVKRYNIPMPVNVCCKVFSDISEKDDKSLNKESGFVFVLKLFGVCISFIAFQSCNRQRDQWLRVAHPR